VSTNATTLSRQKPPRRRIQPDKIPAMIRSMPRWVGWRWEWNAKAKKWDKPPISIKTLRKTSKTDPESWSTFDDAMAACNAGKVDGIGFCIAKKNDTHEADDELVAIDLDNCLDAKTGRPNEWAAHLLELFSDSYAERSPSGLGIKIFILGKLGPGLKENEARGIELLGAGSYCCITGGRCPDSPSEIVDAQDRIDHLQRDVVQEKPRAITNGQLSDRDMALAALDGLDDWRRDDYKSWIRVGQCLHSIDTSLCPVWDSWSRGSDRYTEGACAEKWQTFSTAGSGLRIGTLIYWAKEDGWVPPKREHHAANGTAAHSQNGSCDAWPIGAVVRPKDRDNFGKVVCDLGDQVELHFDGAKGSARVKFNKSDCVLLGGSAGSSPKKPILRFSVREMSVAYPTLDPPIIEGWLRVREILNLISVSKIGKSWLVYYILLCLATGRSIFDRFATTAGPVLLIDNELPPPLLPFRIATVAEALGITPDEYIDKFHVWSLRASPRSIFDLAGEFADVPPETYQLIALDAKYKSLGPDADENSNADEARFFAEAGALAESTRSALMLVHHSTKGSQSDKRVVDVGSGGSSQARAADTHLILREHEEPDCVVLAAALRSFAPVDPLGLRWQFPLWTADDSLDVGQLKGNATKAEESQKGRDAEADQAVLSAVATWASRREIRTATGMNEDRVNRTLARLMGGGFLEQDKQNRRGNECEVFRKSIKAF